MKKWFEILLIFAVIFLLTGCGGKTPTDAIADGAKETIDNLYNTLPEECRTDTAKIMAQESKKQIDAIVTTCEEQKATLRAKISERNAIIAALSVLILLYVGGKVFLKLRP